MTTLDGYTIYNFKEWKSLPEVQKMYDESDDCHMCDGSGKHDCECGDCHTCGNCNGKGKELDLYWEYHRALKSEIEKMKRYAMQAAEALGGE